MSEPEFISYEPRLAGAIEQRLQQQLASELSVAAKQVAVTMGLLADGATVPFIARYRKEMTGGLDDVVLRQLEERLGYLKELEARRDVILSSVADQGQLTPALAQAITQADSKQRLEDLYVPYKPKRRTRAQIAREAGLAPLAVALMGGDAAMDPQLLAQAYVNADLGVADTKAALDGARDILTEQFAENADLVAHLREMIWSRGFVYARVVAGKEQEGSNFRDWFEFQEPLRQIPSHRMLALLRGRQQGILDIRVGLSPDEDVLLPHPCTRAIAHCVGLLDTIFEANTDPRAHWLADVCRWAWRVKLLLAFEMEMITRLRESAESEAIRVFAANLKDLLLAPPAGAKSVLGLDPGIRTGVKVAVIDHTGKVVETTTIYPFEPRRDVVGSLATLARIAKTHQVELVAIGNGTASRETEKLVAALMKANPSLALTKVVVSEAGASVYSASALASEEFPDLDVSLRGAVSIARRLQDPLAELVKIEPKAIGVGQYQHDVNQRQLSHGLQAVIEDCVNAVGVDVNTASVPLLTNVSGLNSSLAKNIVTYRDLNGAFKSRRSLMSVPRFGEKAFEQAAGFLRIQGGENPLDASAVHPEAYPVVQKILAQVKADLSAVMGNPEALKGLSPAAFTDERFGLPTVKDILNELEKPGRDPRPEFKTATFDEQVQSMSDLQVGMVLEGVVTNVANFGAFVDIGVHQDGLVHISALANVYVKDPRDVVRTGQTVTVKVVEVDQARKRIALTMRLDDDVMARQAPRGSAEGSGQAGHPGRAGQKPARQAAVPRQSPAPAPATGAMADAFAQLKRRG
ncbi:MAG: Tex family protein [Orrella sp.]|jgi:protein Tex